MAPLILLVATFAILFAINKYALGSRFSVSLIGRIAMAAMLLLAGVLHFTSTGIEIMVNMMPDAIPYKLELVYFTGVCELAAVVGLLWNKISRLTSIMLIIFFLAILPANIAGSIKQINFGGMEYGVIYLLFRIPLQIFFIWWVWYFGVRRTATSVDQRG